LPSEVGGECGKRDVGEGTGGGGFVEDGESVAGDEWRAGVGDGEDTASGEGTGDVEGIVGDGGVAVDFQLGVGGVG
jgi:hypothetical protein